MKARIGAFLRRVGWAVLAVFCAYALARMAYFWWLLMVTQEW